MRSPNRQNHESITSRRWQYQRRCSCNFFCQIVMNQSNHKHAVIGSCNVTSYPLPPWYQFSGFSLLCFGTVSSQVWLSSYTWWCGVGTGGYFLPLPTLFLPLPTLFLPLLITSWPFLALLYYNFPENKSRVCRNNSKIFLNYIALYLIQVQKFEHVSTCLSWAKIIKHFVSFLCFY